MKYIEIEQRDSNNNIIRYTAGIDDHNNYVETDPENGSLESHTVIASIDDYTLTGDEWRDIDANEALENIVRAVLLNQVDIETAIKSTLADISQDTE